MNLPIVPFDVAKDLKKLGFDWKHTDNFNAYNKYGYGKYGHDLVNARGVIPAPTQPEVCKWLRDEKGIVISIEYNVITYTFSLKHIDPSNELIVESGGFNSFEQAELAAIKKAIEILKP